MSRRGLRRGAVTSLIEQARGRAAVAINAELTMLCWGIGTRIREDVLGLEKPGERRFYEAIYSPRKRSVDTVWSAS